MFVCAYVFLCMYVRMYVCTNVRIYVHMYECMYVYIYVGTYYVCT